MCLLEEKAHGKIERSFSIFFSKNIVDKEVGLRVRFEESNHVPKTLVTKLIFY